MGATSSTRAPSDVASESASAGPDASTSIETNHIVENRSIPKYAVETDVESDAAEALRVQCSDCSLELPWRVLRLADGRCPPCAGVLGKGSFDPHWHVADS